MTIETENNKKQTIADPNSINPITTTRIILLNKS